MATTLEGDPSETLRSFSTCDISDVLLKLKHPFGGFLPGLSMRSPGRYSGESRLVGPAYTVRFVANDELEAPKLEKHYIDTVPDGAVIFISSPKGIAHAVYGGLMSCRALFSGARGTVIDGCFRDLEEQRRLGYAVFARDVATPSYYEIVRASEVNVPVQFHDDRIDTIINPGDWIVGDINGIVCIPQQLLEKVLAMLPGHKVTESAIEVDLLTGCKFAQASKHRKN